MRTPRFRSVVGVAVVAAMLVAVGVVARSLVVEDDDSDVRASGHPAEVVVEGLLRLRLEGVTDAEAYARTLEDTGVAGTLADDAQGGVPSIPTWTDVYLSKLEGDTAEVAVVWSDSEEFPEWAAETVFTVRLSDDGWRVTDALEHATAETTRLVNGASEPMNPESTSTTE